MDKRLKRPLFIVSLVLFYVLISFPYLFHPSQDLPNPVGWDEAAHRINAKDIVLFGPASLSGDRLNFIIFPIHTLISIISFFLFGVSLFSLRFPYIMLNILGNILFFDFLRKTRGWFWAFLITPLFAYYTPRLLMGKSAMGEALVLPLILLLLWLWAYKDERRGFHFWLGGCSALIVWSKLDNIFIFLFVVFSVLVTYFAFRTEANRRYKRQKMMEFSAGAGLILLSAFIFYCWVGWDKVIFQFKYILTGPLGLSSWSFLPYTPFTKNLILRNLIFIYAIIPGFSMVLGVCLLPYLLIMWLRRRESLEPLGWSIALLLAVLAGKIAVTSDLYLRRLIPCIPLSFLLIVYVLSYCFDRLNSKNGGIMKAVGTTRPQRSYLSVIRISLWSVVFVLLCVMYYPDLGGKSLFLLFSPRFSILHEARQFAPFVQDNAKVLFLDGRFGYLAIQSPNKFIDIPPDLSSADFYTFESNPALARRMILQDDKIGYVLCRYDNVLVREILEREFHARLIAQGVAGNGFLYELPRAVPQKR
jgi:cbb3-type cytochrome oxidase subunit 3